MRKKCVFGCATICALTALTSCGFGGNPAGPKPTLYIEEYNHTDDLHLAPNGKVSAYIELDMSRTKLEEYKPHEISFSADDSSVTITTGSIVDYTPADCYWVATFTKVGSFTVTASLGGEKSKNSLSFDVGPARVIDFKYKAPKDVPAFKYVINAESNPIEAYKINDSYMKIINGRAIYFEKIGEDKYVYYSYDKESKTWNKREGREYKLDELLENVIFSEAMCGLPDEYTTKEESNVVIKTKTSTGETDKNYAVTVYHCGQNFYKLCSTDDFAFCLAREQGEGSQRLQDSIDLIDYTVSEFPIVPPTK